MKVVPVVLLLASVAFAGCADADADSPLATDGLPDGTPAEELAQLQGTVLSDAGLVLRDARVLVAGAATSQTSTDVNGTFLLAELLPGTYTLRVEAADFRVHERSIDLAAGQTETVEVVLVPQDTSNPNYQPHVHDYWAGRDEVELDPVTVDIGTARVGSSTSDLHPVLNTASATVLYANLVYGGLQYAIHLQGGDERQLIYQGTETIEVTFTWDDAPPNPPLYALRYAAPVKGADPITLDPGPSGTTWSIDITPEMADNGHQQFSLWEFYIRPVNDPREDAGAYRPALADHEVQVDIKLIRGDQPLPEPAHPRFWENGTELVLLTHEDSARSKARPPPLPSSVTWRPLDAIVPPGTTLIRAELKWTADDPLPAPLDAYDLYYNPGDQNPLDRPYSEYVEATPTTDDAANGVRVYEIAVDPSQTDAFYQQVSSWRFAPISSGSGSPDDPDSNILRDRTLSLHLTAIQGDGSGIQ